MYLLRPNAPIATKCTYCDQMYLPISYIFKAKANFFFFYWKSYDKEDDYTSNIYGPIFSVLTPMRQNFISDRRGIQCLFLINSKTDMKIYNFI